ncbi:MAG: helix-turn-helix domain-containing protein [Desertimonas sp.]
MSDGYAEHRAAGVPGVAWTARATPGPSWILPDGGMDLIWDGATVVVAGADSVAQRGHVAVPTRLVGLRFDPGVAPSVVGVPADVLTDQRVTLDLLAGRNVHDRWCERLAAARAPTAELIELAADRLIGTDDPPPRWLGAVVGGLRRGETVTDVADRVGYTTRHLNRLAGERFGYGPKTLSRVLRFQRALPALRAGADATMVAARVGYADAAHLYRDVRRLSGGSVAALRQPSSA